MLPSCVEMQIPKPFFRYWFHIYVSSVGQLMFDMFITTAERRVWHVVDMFYQTVPQVLIHINQINERFSLAQLKSPTVTSNDDPLYCLK